MDVVKNGMIKRIGFFNTAWDTALTTDASPTGLSGIVTQSNPKDPNEVMSVGS